MGRDQQRLRRGESPWQDYPAEDDFDDLAYGWNQYGNFPGADGSMFGGGNYHVSTVELLEERDDFTPDFYKFRDKEEVPLFVFDSMKWGGSRNTILLKNCNYYGTAHTVQKNWRLYKPEKRRLETLAFQVTESKEGVQASIRGELWGVSPEHILDIDEYLRNTMAVQRVQRLVICEEQEPYKPNGSWKVKHRAVEKAYLYVAKTRYWDAGTAGNLEPCVRVTYTGETVPDIARNKQFYDLTVSHMGTHRFAS